MKFTTHCFVRVEDAEKRKDVIEWCMHIGYEYIYPPKEERLGDKVICDTYCVGVAHDAQTFTALNCHRLRHQHRAVQGAGGDEQRERSGAMVLIYGISD